MELKVWAPNPYLERTNRLSELASKISYVLLHNAKDKLRGGARYNIPLLELMDLVGFKSKNTEYIRETLKEIMGIVLDWDIFDIHGKRMGWEASPILGYVKYHGSTGLVEYGYSEVIIDFFKKELDYTILSLEVARTIKGKYALALWEICKRFQGANGRSTGWRPIEEWRGYLGLKKGQYASFSVFSRDLLKKSIKEINRHSDLLVKMEYKRGGPGGKVSHIKFTSKPNKNYGKATVKQMEMFEGPKIDRKAMPKVPLEDARARAMGWAAKVKDEDAEKKKAILEKAKTDRENLTIGNSDDGQTLVQDANGEWVEE